MKSRAIILLAVIGLVAVGGLYSSRELRFETNLEAYSLVTLQDQQHYDSLQLIFSAPQYNETVVVVENEELWDSQNDFLELDKFTTFCSALPGVKSAMSLTNLMFPTKGVFHARSQLFLDVNDSLAFENRLAELDRFEDITQKFLSEDGRYSLLFISPEDEKLNAQTIEAIQQFDHPNHDIRVHLVNYDLVDHELEKTMRKDGQLLALISIMLILLSFFMLTKSLKGLALITLMVGFNLSLVVLFMLVMDIGFTVHMIAIPCLIIILSFTDIMHLLYHQRLLGGSLKPASELRAALIKEVQLPMILTSLTNVLGFVVFLILAENDFLFNLALVAIVGVFIAFLSARFLLIYLVADLSPLIKRSDYRKLTEVHKRIAQQVFRKKTWLYSGLAIAAGGLLVWVNVNFKIESSEGDLLAGQSNLNHAAEVLQQEFFGEKEIECIVDLQGRDVWSPEVLQALNDLENHVEELMKPLYISSPVVVAKRYHRYTRNGRQEAFSLPEQFSASSRKEIQKHLGDLGAGAMVADDGQHVKMTIGFVDPSLEHRRLTYEKLEEYVADMSKSGIAIELTGKSYISDRGTYRFTIKVLIGLLVGLFGASVVVFLVLKSARQSLGLLVVNLFPVLAVVGLMLLADIHLTAESLFFLSLLAGICIDDSIYLITQKRKSRSTHIFPIAVTSVVLAAGFIALGCSSFLWLRPFAWIFLVGITLAYLMDMFVLPLFLLATSDGERDSG